jgi:hypothetical protein
MSKAAYKHLHAGFHVDISFHFIWVNTEACNHWTEWLRECLDLLENCQTVFQTGYVIFHSHQQRMNSYYSTSWSAFGAVSVLVFGHPDRCGVVSHCFNLHFPDDI